MFFSIVITRNKYGQARIR
ncbi:hypothetical protein [Pseudoalteromonas sp. 68 DY56-GL68]